MGSFNSKAAVQQNERPFILSKTNKNENKQEQEGKLAMNKQKISDKSYRNDVRISRLNSETDGDCYTKRAPCLATTDTKRTSNLPQYMWLAASPVEQFDGKKKSQPRLKCSNQGSTFPSLRGQKAKDERTLVDLISERSQSAGNSTQKLPSNYCATQRHSLENIYMPSRSETTPQLAQYKHPNSDVSTIMENTQLNMSVGFGVLISNSHMDSYVTSRGRGNS